MSRRRRVASVVAFVIAGASLFGAFLAPGAGAQTEEPPTTAAPTTAAPTTLPPETPPPATPADPAVVAPIDVAPVATAAETDVPVVVRLATDATTNRLTDDLAAAGGDVTEEYGRVFPGFAAELSDEQVSWLRERPGVVSVEPDLPVVAVGTERADLTASTTRDDPGNSLGTWLVVIAGLAAVTGVVLVGSGRRKGVIAVASIALVGAACAPAAPPAPAPVAPAQAPPTTIPATTTTTLPSGPPCRALSAWGTGLWGIDRIDQTTPWGVNDQNSCLTSNGSGVDGYVFDTGMLCTHTQFEGRAICDPQFDEISGHTSTVDCNGHGTHTAGTIAGKDYGVAPGATVYAVRVLGCTGSGSTSGIIAAADTVIAHHTTRPAVANFSLGGGASSALDAAIQALVADGITVAVSAGNSNADACNSSPARAVNAITVGATTIDDTRSSFSNHGSCVDIMAPGSSVLSSYSTSTTASATLSGTSMSSPHVAGCAARYLAKFPGSSPAQVTSGLVSAATQNVLSDGSSVALPAGTPNKLLYCDPTW